MLWIKAFHIIAMVAWFAGLFYLPRLFVYHTMAETLSEKRRFEMMERRLYYGIMLPAAAITLFLGIWLWIAHWAVYQSALWFHLKLLGVFCLIIFHFYCGRIRRQFLNDHNQHSTIFYRCLNEVPTVLLIFIVVLVVTKPTF